MTSFEASERSATSPSGPLLQRACACGGTCDDCRRHLTLERSAHRDAEGPLYAPPLVHDVLRSGGCALDAATRADMEPRFGRDFSRVRVHTGDAAWRSVAAVGAEAYTVGQHIVLGQRLSPQTRAGRSLLAHELAHTVQQRGVSPAAGPLPIGHPRSASEREADAMAASAAAGRPVASHGARAQLARASRTFLLTFDDGPHAAALGKGTNRTETVLDTLCAKGVGAGFFVQTAAQDKAGAAIRGSSKAGKALITRMAADGHFVGIHTGGTRDHEDHTKALKAGRLASELGAGKSAIAGLTRTTPTTVRPPHGTFTPAVSAVYKKLGLTNVLWDIDGDQGKNLPPSDLKKRVTAGINGMIAGGWKGSTPLAPSIVVLYHDIQKNTAGNIGTLIDFIKSETSALTGGKDTAAFPPISCKTAAPGGGAGADPEGAGDFVQPADDGVRLAAGGGSAAHEEVA